MCSRLANSQLEKEKAELIHQLEVNKDQSGAESTVSGKVFYSSSMLANLFLNKGLPFLFIQMSDDCLPVHSDPLIACFQSSLLHKTVVYNSRYSSIFLFMFIWVLHLIMIQG